MAAWSIGSKKDIQYIKHNTPTTFWYSATIIDTTDNKIKIHYDCDGDDSDDDEWINKDSDRIDVHNSHTLPCINLASAPITCGSKAVYHKEDNIEYILLCTLKEIHRFNITKSKWQKNYAVYPQDLNPSYDDEICFDRNKLCLYVLSISKTVWPRIGILNVKTLQWSVKNIFESKRAKTHCFLLTSLYILCLIPDPINEIHISQDKKHWKLMEKDGIFEMVEINVGYSSDIDCYANVSKLLWIEDQGKLLKFYRNWVNTNDIHEFCYIGNADETDYEWKRLSMTLSHSMPNLFEKVIGAFQNILICIAVYSDHEMWCIDLLSGKSYKSHKLTPINIRGESIVIKTDRNYVHFIDCGWKLHFKALISCL